MCVCAEYSRVRAWEKGNGRLSGEDSMAASGPSQAKHTAKESSGEERRVGETGAGIEDISEDRRRGQKRSGVMIKGTFITEDAVNKSCSLALTHQCEDLDLACF